MATDAIDTSACIETPEHIEFEFRIAGPWRRGWAYLIDLVIRVSVFLILGFILLLASTVFHTVKDIGGASEGVALIAYFGFEWFYFVLFEWLWNGRTPGKRALGLRVVKEGGYPIGPQDAFLRNLLRGADLMPPLLPLGLPVPTYLVGILACAADGRFRRLGDMVAGTMVVVDEPVRLRAPAPVEPPASVDELAVIPAHPRLSVDERKTLDAFMRRFRLIHPARREEICLDFARVLARRLGSPEPESGARYLQLVYARLAQAADPIRRGAT
jgi:uncharacterized RDD family membrane protein YckC